MSSGDGRGMDGLVTPVTTPTPETLRIEAAGWRFRQHFTTGDLLVAAADAWEADKGSWLQARDRLGELLDETASLRKRLEEAEKEVLDWEERYVEEVFSAGGMSVFDNAGRLADIERRRAALAGEK